MTTQKRSNFLSVFEEFKNNKLSDIIVYKLYSRTHNDDLAYYLRRIRVFHKTEMINRGLIASLHKSKISFDLLYESIQYNLSIFQKHRLI